ncbi:methyl-accepting chemotaxis protein [Ferviditalea candida]|uniref:Methyl-accepting chemotaxis protein n=1 Tax=Ferviditalea candida TaxID=3108399 RepID=A0ABU5ZP13_9BACL|nr:methyl-accepting chemotaxis protein [Paenibacillaceae bacterium T2]
MRLSILQKLILGYLIIAFIAGGAGLVYYQSLNRVHQSFLSLMDHQALLKSYADNMKFFASSQNGNLYAFLLTQDAFNKLQLTSVNDSMNELLAEARPLINNPAMLEQLDYVAKLNKQYKDKAEKIFDLPKGQLEQAAQEVKTGVLPLGGVIMKFAEQLSSQQDQLMQEGKITNDKTVASMKQMILIISIIIFSMAFGIGLLISRIISRPIVMLSGAAKSISNGDLAIEKVRVNQRDEIGQLTQAFNQMIENLRYLVVRINESTKEVTSISKDVSAGTEQTKYAAGQITEIMEKLMESSINQVQEAERSLQAIYEMTRGIDRIDQSSREAMMKAEQALGKALDGDAEIVKITHQMNTMQDIMQRMKSIMQLMQARSNEIGEINSVISEISNHTNLLSLNAAIEAARAGGHGRGFSVVTAEIRKLANQSNESTRRVTELVHNVQTETKHAADSVEEMSRELFKGISASREVSELFGDIKLLCNETTNQIREVFGSSQQLSKYSKQIVQSMEQLSGISGMIAAGTQNVTASTEEQFAFLQQNAAHSQTLSVMAERLQSSVSQFKLQ